jgi:p-hydroxybenzoate 3-monooxygenase
MRTQVGIVGAGPAGLFLSHLLAKQGVDSVVLEAQSRAYVEGRVRAGVLEAGTIDTMNNIGLGARMRAEGMVDDRLNIRFRGKEIRLDLPGLTGRHVMIYGQQEVVKDLIAARLAADLPLLFEAEVGGIENIQGPRPGIRFRKDGVEQVLECDFVAGCDGFHGACRQAPPEGVIRSFVKTYDFAWLGVLAHAAPIADMTYANHDRGFALCSRRSSKVSRLYLQAPGSDAPENWTDRQFWDELHARMFDTEAQEIQEGEIFQRDVARLRAYIADPMQYGRLFLAGDACHIVPPAGAKGLNMAVGDVRTLARGLFAFYREGSRDGLDRYSADCIDRVWKTIRYSVTLTSRLHRFEEQTPFERGMPLAELEFLHGSPAAQRVIAEQYVRLSDVSD